MPSHCSGIMAVMMAVIIVIPAVGTGAALVQLLGDHGLRQLDCTIEARDGDLALGGARIHLAAIRDLDRDMGTLHENRSG